MRATFLSPRSTWPSRAATGLRLAGVCGIERGHPAAPETVLPDEASLWPVGEVLRTQNCKWFRDLETAFGTALPTGPWSAAADPGRRAASAADGRSRPARRAGRWAQPVPAVRRQLSRLPGPDRRPDRRRHRQRPGLRGGASPRRGPGGDRSRQDGIFLQRQSRIPHATHADDRADRGRAERRRRPSCPPSSATAWRSRTATACACSSWSTRCWTSRASRPAGSKRSFEPTDLAAFTAELASNFESATEKAGLTLRIDCPAAAAAGQRRPRDVGEDRSEPAVQRLQVHLRR